jgi:hypothetical protein
LLICWQWTCWPFIWLAFLFQTSVLYGLITLPLSRLSLCNLSSPLLCNARQAHLLLKVEPSW